MDRKYIDDHHVVARYLADQLTDEERGAFEAYYLANPEILQEMEAAARFKVGLMQLRDARALPAVLQPRPWFRDARYLAAAAAVAIVVIGTSFFVARGPAAQPLLARTATTLVDRLGAPLPVIATHTILRTRSTSYDAEIDVPSAAGSIELQVLPEVEAQPPRYRISLAAIKDDDSLTEVAVVADLRPNDEGFVPVFLNGARLKPGRYRLLLAGDAGTSAASDESTFLLRVR